MPRPAPCARPTLAYIELTQEEKSKFDRFRKEGYDKRTALMLCTIQRTSK